MAKLYTKNGDEGATSICAAQRVSKHDIRIEACGTIDELNASLGLAIIRTDNEPIQDQLKLVQQDLFSIGTDCATPTDQKNTLAKKITDEDIKRLEKAIDKWSEKLPPLKNFIIPGGENGAAEIHVARTVCRRAERVASQLLVDKQINSESFRYLNRLSDLLFIQARYVQESK
ncbi:cob(I)yrinic acid a,c-diamide adenosyltransferase [Patescibacteria group bacterium]